MERLDRKNLKSLIYVLPQCGRIHDNAIEDCSSLVEDRLVIELAGMDNVFMGGRFGESLRKFHSTIISQIRGRLGES